MAMDEAVSGRLVRWTAAAGVDWEAVFTEQLPRIYNFFRYRVGGGADVEDLTSLTFEKAWRARHRYRRDLAGFTTWLLTIARNVAIDHFRSARPLVPIDEAALVTTGTTSEDLAADRSDQARLAALMADLPDRDRELLALKYGAGLNNREIARLMLPEQTIRITADTERLRRVLESLAIRDLTIPDTLDGQTATITVPPIVEMKYESANRMAILVQARSPNITVPAGLDLPLFGEIGLRILGLGRAEARRFAHAIDWHTTLLVPVPANATSFRQVDVAGRRGLVIETAASPASQQRRQRFTIVLWSDGGQMFAMRGTLTPRDMLEIASSVP